MTNRKLNRDEAIQAREEKLELVAFNVERAVEQLVTGEDWIGAIAFAAKFRAYSFQNALAIWAQHQHAYEKGLATAPYPSHVASFTLWKSLDRYPIAGRGYIVLAPIHSRFASSDPTGDQWRRLKPGEKARTGETTRSVRTGFKPVHVWDASQTTGEGKIPEKPMPQLLKGEAPEGLWDGLATLIGKEGFELRSTPTAAALGGANGMTDFDSRIVTVREDMDDAARVKTLAHELGHVLMTDPQMRGRELHRGIWEVEAESLAAMIGACYGMDTSRYTAPYVAGWAEAVKDKTAVEVVRDTGKRVREAALKALDGLPEPPTGTGLPSAPDQSQLASPARGESRAPSPEPLRL